VVNARVRNAASGMDLLGLERDGHKDTA